MSTASAMKVTVVLNASGQVAAASKHKAYTPAQGEEPVLTFGMAADLGQTLVEMEVPSDVAALVGDELLSQLANHASIKAAIDNSPALRHTTDAAQKETESFGTV